MKKSIKDQKGAAVSMLWWQYWTWWAAGTQSRRKAWNILQCILDHETGVSQTADWLNVKEWSACAGVVWHHSDRQTAH